MNYCIFFTFPTSYVKIYIRSRKHDLGIHWKVILAHVSCTQCIVLRTSKEITIALLALYCSLEVQKSREGTNNRKKK